MGALVCRWGCAGRVWGVQHGTALPCRYGTVAWQGGVWVYRRGHARGACDNNDNVHKQVGVRGGRGGDLSAVVRTSPPSPPPPFGLCPSLNFK
jgi:hypothetical protein